VSAAPAAITAAAAAAAMPMTSPSCSPPEGAAARVVGVGPGVWPGVCEGIGEPGFAVWRGCGDGDCRWRPAWGGVGLLDVGCADGWFDLDDRGELECRPGLGVGEDEAWTEAASGR
jgi:hypothetical protein